MDVGSRVEGEATKEVWAERLRSEGWAIAVKVRGWGVSSDGAKGVGVVTKAHGEGDTQSEITIKETTQRASIIL